MITWRDRKRIAEEERLRHSLMSLEETSRWQKALRIINSPIVIAVAVSSILGFFSQTFHKSETCFEQLANANRFRPILNAEIAVRLNQKKLGYHAASDDIDAILNAFVAADLQDHQHVNSSFKDKSFIELLGDREEIIRAFGLPKESKEEGVIFLLSTNLLAANVSPEKTRKDLLRLIAQELSVPELGNVEPGDLREYLDSAIISITMYPIRNSQLPYSCRWLSVAKREITIENSPFAIGAFPSRSN